MATDITVPSPRIVIDLIDGFRRSKTMFAAVSLGVFDVLRDGPLSAFELASRLNAHPDAMERLLHGCVGLGLLNRSDRGYANTSIATTYLSTASPRRLTGYINYSNDALWPMWGHLEDAIREGSHRWKQTFGWDGSIFEHFFRSDAAKREFLMGMNGFGLLSSPRVVSAFDLSRFRCLVDLGGGTAHLAITACLRYPALRAIVFDLPAATSMAREMIDASGLNERISILAGDFFRDPLPEGDLFALGRILHDWTEEKIGNLLRRIFDRLPPGGALLVAEKLLNEDKDGPMGALMQSLNMLVCTEGKERSLSEYDALLQKAGFRDVTGCRTDAPLDAILAVKRSEQGRDYC